MKQDDCEYRVVPKMIGTRNANISADTKGRLLTGYAVLFNVKSCELPDKRGGSFYEVIKPGATRNSILNKDILALYSHDIGNLLGRTSSGTLTCIEDGVGVRFVLNVPKTSLGDDTLELVRRKDLFNMSFGFNVPMGGDQWTTDDSGYRIRTVSEMSLNEISIVFAGAYEQTSVVAPRIIPVNRNRKDYPVWRLQQLVEDELQWDTHKQLIGSRV